MRLVTRADFDGLACAVLLNAMGLIGEYKFVHPKDVQDGLIDVDENDILANVPYAPGCGMWFDHHSSEKERVGKPDFKGSSKPGPSCARVIWDYYGYDKFPQSLEPMLDAVDKVDSATISAEEVKNPTGWVLLGMVMDPRTGLGRYADYRISEKQLMMDMIDYCGRLSADEILVLPDVKERTDRYFAQQKDFTAMIEHNAALHDNVLVINLLEEKEIFTGNRFTAYALFPEANVSVQMLWGKGREKVVFTVGHSIINRTCSADVGSIMLSHGGGGHRRVGTCQIETEKCKQVLEEIIEALKGR